MRDEPLFVADLLELGRQSYSAGRELRRLAAHSSDAGARRICRKQARGCFLMVRERMAAARQAADCGLWAESFIEPRLDMTPEGYVLEWHRRGRPRNLVLEPWEAIYQKRGVIEAAYRKGYIDIGRDAACTISLRERGETLLSEHGPATVVSGDGT